jgi:opacity protein-like surface antigen
MLARLAFVLATLAAASVSAQPYGGGSIGQAQYPDACAGAAGITCDSSDRAIRFFVGYGFTPHFAIEWGYGMLGTLRASTGEAADLSAADLSLIGSWPIVNRFSAQGRLGVYAGTMEGLRAKATTEDTPPCPLLAPGAPPGVVLPPCPPPAPPQRGWQNGTNTDITYGLGLSYAITQSAALRVEWQRFQNFGGAGGPKLDVDLFSIGAVVHVQ